MLRNKAFTRRLGRNSNSGFTLLETIVALVIFSTSGMALYSLVNTNLVTLTRVQSVSQQVPVVENAIEILSMMNLQEEQNGEFDINGYDIFWQAQLLEPYRMAQNQAGYEGYHKIGLYRVNFQVQDGRKLIGEYKLRLVGHTLVGGPSL